MATVAGLLSKYRGWAADCERLQAEYQAKIDRLEGSRKSGEALEANARAHIRSCKVSIAWYHARQDMAKRIVSDLEELINE